MNISALIFSKNAAAHIETTLRSVQFAQEIMLVDMMSTDDTLRLAKPLVSRVIQFPDEGFVEPIRNSAIKEATGDWILILDADESVPPQLQNRLQLIAQEAERDSSLGDCFYVPRKNMIFGDWMRTAGWWPDLVLRFFKKGYVEWSSEIHSVPITRGVVKELASEEQLALIHQNYQSVDQYVNRLNRYTSIQAEQRMAQSAKTTRPLGAATVLHAFRTEFLSRLFARDGIRGGVRGVSLSLLQAMSDAVVVLKTVELHHWQEPERQKTALMDELDALRHDLAYWLADERIRHTTGLVRWYWRLRRRLAL